MDPLVRSTEPIIQDLVLTAFAAQVRSSYSGRGRQIEVLGVSDALDTISKTIELAGLTHPLYRAPKCYTLPLKCCITGMHREDLPAIPQLAVTKWHGQATPVPAHYSKPLET